MKLKKICENKSEIDSIVVFFSFSFPSYFVIRSNESEWMKRGRQKKIAAVHWNSGIKSTSDETRITCWKSNRVQSTNGTIRMESNPASNIEYCHVSIPYCWFSAGTEINDNNWTKERWNHMMHVSTRKIQCDDLISLNMHCKTHAKNRTKKKGNRWQVFLHCWHTYKNPKFRNRFYSGLILFVCFSNSSRLCDEDFFFLCALN